jgi:plasmid stability protein
VLRAALGLALLDPYLTLDLNLAARVYFHYGSISHHAEEATMATLTIKNIPDVLHQRLKERAKQHRRSINSEVIVCLEQVLGSAPIDRTALLASIRAHRKSIPEAFVTDEYLRAAKNEGRL